MPETIAGIILPQLIVALGQLSVPQIMVAQHQWPSPALAGLTRRRIAEALVQLSAETDRSRAHGQKVVADMLRLARMSPQRLQALEDAQLNVDAIDPLTTDMRAAGKALDANQPGRFAELLSTGRPMHLAGACMGDLVTEGDFVLTDPAAPIAPGDMVMLAVAGCMFMEAKIFLATFTRDGIRRAAFYQAMPSMIWDVPLADVYHADRIAYVQSGGDLRPANADGLLDQVQDVLAIHDNGTLPKAERKGLLTGWDRALRGILDVMRAAPERAEQATAPRHEA